MESQDNNGSIFNLTLDEVQSQLDSLGKPLTNMNLEELVTTVGTTDSNSNNVVANIECEDMTTTALAQERTLVELTLEDFLAKAGIVTEGVKSYVTETSSQDSSWMHVQVQQPTFLQCKNMVQVTDTQTVSRKRVVTVDISDKAAERRHKRMIKNRESAARSRERKHAYTQQLELRLAELEDENVKLKADEAPNAVLPVTETQLHRTRSAPI